MKRFPLHWQILIGLVLGVIYGIFANEYNLEGFTADWILPWGTIFINCLKLIAVPLVIFSLISGIASLKDISKLSSIGTKTILLYLSTTVIAITVGLVMVNVFKPWEGVDVDVKASLMEMYQGQANDKLVAVSQVEQRGPLQFLIDIVPSNILSAATDNKNMLNVIFFSMLFGIAMLMVEEKYSSPVKAFFDGFSAIIIKMVNIIMYIAPIGTFALIAGLLTNFGMEIIGVVLGYTLVVILSLIILAFTMYPLLLNLLAKYPIRKFFKSIAPAQLLAFSTSSSAATLPITIKSVRENVGVSDEVSSFVLPLGATINMDGTSCYQAVAAVFIANLMGVDLDFTDQLSIVLTATLASIGTAAVPSAGIVMLAIVLGQLKVPMEGIAIIIGVDRLLDMCRTVVNVTGDATIATIVAYKTGQLKENINVKPE